MEKSADIEISHSLSFLSPQFTYSRSRKRTPSGSRKSVRNWSWPLTVELGVNWIMIEFGMYESWNGVLSRRLYYKVELSAYQSVRSKSFDCIRFISRYIHHRQYWFDFVEPYSTNLRSKGEKGRPIAGYTRHMTGTISESEDWWLQTMARMKMDTKLGSADSSWNSSKTFRLLRFLGFYSVIPGVALPLYSCF